MIWFIRWLFPLISVTVSRPRLWTTHTHTLPQSCNPNFPHILLCQLAALDYISCVLFVTTCVANTRQLIKINRWLTFSATAFISTSFHVFFAWHRGKCVFSNILDAVQIQLYCNCEHFFTNFCNCYISLSHLAYYDWWLFCSPASLNYFFQESGIFSETQEPFVCFPPRNQDSFGF